MKPNRNRSRDLGFYIIMLAILITVVMLLTKQPTPNQIENYSELADLFRQERVKSFRVIPSSSGSAIELEVRPALDSSAETAKDEAAPTPTALPTPALAVEESTAANPDGTEKMNYDLYSFSVFYEDFHDLILEQYKAGTIEKYDYTEGFTLPWWASFVPYLVIMFGAMALWYFMMNRAGGGGAGGFARFSKARTKLGSDEKDKKTFKDCKNLSV